MLVSIIMGMFGWCVCSLVISFGLFGLVFGMERLVSIVL